VSPKQAERIASSGESLDRDQRRHVAPASMTNRQAKAFRVKLREQSKSKLRQLDFCVESRR
jgi:hypothetical protein